MIVIDTEGTGLLKSLLLPLDQQPEIIELAAVKLDNNTLAEIAHIHFLIKPRIQLGAETTKITGITNEMLEKCGSFATRVPALTAFFLGESHLVAHNLDYDSAMLMLEMQRLGRARRFPWPPEHIDTVELTMDLDVPRQKSARLKLGELYQWATGEPMPVAHRALDDTRALCVIVRALRKHDGRI